MEWSGEYSYDRSSGPSCHDHLFPTRNGMNEMIGAIRIYKKLEKDLCFPYKRIIKEFQ